MGRDVTVFVGYLQLAEYGETISVHDRVEWQVSRFPSSDFDRRISAAFHLDRYAGALGVPTVALAGVVTAIDEVLRGDGAPEPRYTTGPVAADCTLGFVVQVSPAAATAE